MKKNLVNVFVVALGGFVGGTAFADPMTTEETRALVEAYAKHRYTAFSTPEEIDRWGAYYADDVEVHYNTTGPLGHYFFGRKGFLDWNKRLTVGTDFEAGVKVD